MTYDITNGPQTVTGTGPVPGTLDTSLFSGDFTLRVEVSALSPAGAVAIIAVEDTANASAFSDAVQVAVFEHVVGTVDSHAPIELSIRKYLMSGTRFGDVDSKLRVNVLSLSGSSPSLTLRGTLQQQ